MSETNIVKRIEPLWDVKRTAAYLLVKPNTVYTWVRQGKIKFTKVGRSVRFTESSVLAMVEKQKTKIK